MKNALSKAKKEIQPKVVRKSKKNDLGCSFPSAKKNMDNMKLLVSYPATLEIIEETRANLGMPMDGFRTSDSSFRAWYDSYIQKTDDVRESKEFIKKEQAIKTKWREHKISPKSARKMLDRLFHKVPLHYFGFQVRRIIRQFNVPENYEQNIKSYIYFGKITAPCSNFIIGPYNGNELMRKTHRVPITIYAKLTDSDLREIKLNVNKYFGKDNLPFIQDSKNIDRDLEIEHWHQNRKRFDSVENEEYEVSTEEIAENLLGSRKKKNKVYNAVSNIKKLRKRRFGKP